MKKNILYISPKFNLACGVSKHIFTLLTSEELKKEFNLHFITNGGDALFKLDKAEVNHHILNFITDKIVHFDFFRNKREIEKFCKEKEIHLIHSHHRYPEYISNVITKALKIKTVITVHNFVNRLKSISYKSDCIIAISNAVANQLIQDFKISSAKIKVLYNCIDKRNTPEKNKENIKGKIGNRQNKKILLYAGRFRKEKGTRILLDAFKLLEKNHQNIFLLWVGDDKDSLMVNKGNVDAERIRVFPPQENIAEFYAVSDFIILPSLNEGLGYSMLEAGYFKKPFIGSRTGGIAEFIDDGVNGFLFEPGNADDLAEKIKFVINNPEKAKSAAEELHKKVKKYCNCEEYFEKLTNIYNELLNE